MAIELFFEDCYDTLCRLPDASIDLMLQDPPYGTTQNEWDIKPDLPKMWKQWLRVIKPNGAIIFTSAQPFTSELVMSMPDLFRYDIIWKKTGKPTGFLNCEIMPLRSHENVLVFYKKTPTYNPQKTKGKPSHPRGKPSINKKNTNNNYGSFDYGIQGKLDDNKYPVSVIEFPQPHPAIHPTQKPVDLMRYFILTYSNPGDTVFDGYVGVGATPRACIMEDRNFKGSETKRDFYDKSMQFIREDQMQYSMFSASNF